MIPCHSLTGSLPLAVGIVAKTLTKVGSSSNLRRLSHALVFSSPLLEPTTFSLPLITCNVTGNHQPRSGRRSPSIDDTKHTLLRLFLFHRNQCRLSSKNDKFSVPFRPANEPLPLFHRKSSKVIGRSLHSLFHTIARISARFSHHFTAVPFLPVQNRLAFSPFLFRTILRQLR